MDMPCLSVMSTRSSGRSDCGKNCMGMSRMPARERKKTATVMATVLRGWLTAKCSMALNHCCILCDPAAFGL